MESFEQLCRVALEEEGFAVTGNVKFFVRRRTRKQEHEEYQEHGYEVDLVAARSRKLVLAEVKSYLGSQGVSRQAFRGLADETKRTRFERFKLFNEPELRAKVIGQACERYGYRPRQVEMRLYVGKFAGGPRSGRPPPPSRVQRPLGADHRLTGDRGITCQPVAAQDLYRRSSRDDSEGACGRRSTRNC